MKLKWIRIENYRSCAEVEITVSSLHALVGANNAGKSNILRALDFFFNPPAKIDKEAFWNGDLSNEITIEAIFTDLTPQESNNEELKKYLNANNNLHIKRIAKCKEKDTDRENNQYEEKLSLSLAVCQNTPKQEWLVDSNINTANINKWWKKQEALKVNGVSFVKFMGNPPAKPKVGDWKRKAEEFRSKHLSEGDFEETWQENPTGLDKLLKETLPTFIFVPAVREVTDETRVLKSNPFGKILYMILNDVTSEQKNEIGETLRELECWFNRVGGNERIESITRIEDDLNEVINQYMPKCELEIEFQTPNFETLLTSPQLFIDDGFRNIVSNKGHGLQRSVIFAILQCYSDQVTRSGKTHNKNMILAVEEPELYMHPQAQKNIRKVFQNISKKGDQIIFATHSPNLVDVAYFDEIIRVEANRKIIDGEHRSISTKIWQLTIDDMLEDLKVRHPGANDANAESIRELYSHAYHPNRSEGFFADKIILVEGATEQYSLPIYADACGFSFESRNISVVDCGGKGSMDRLYRIFNELGIPCYLLFDYDKNNKDKKIKRKSKELLELLGEIKDREEPETIKIEDKYAFFPETWEKYFAGENSRIEKLEEEAKNRFGYKKDGGKPLIARYVAQKLTSSDPPEVPDSIKQIIEKAVDTKWGESCLEKKQKESQDR